MKKLTCEIGIGDYIYEGVVNLQIQHSIETLTDTCVITFPRKVQWENEKITDLIKRGDELYVLAGYDLDHDKVFTGIIRDINADIPVTVQADDYMFKLKKNSIKTSFQKASLSDILKGIIPNGIKWKADEIDLGKFRINNATPAKVVEHLKRKYGIYSYFKHDTLYSGLRYWGDQNLWGFSFTKDIISHSLTYKLAEDIRLQIKAISIMPDNSKVEPDDIIGDADGEIRTYHYYNIGKKELERRANQELEKLKYDGYRGTFTTFGQPTVFHGDAVKLIDKRYGREGIYIVKSVNRSFGMQGYRQTIELDRLWT